jgi:membrane protease YdiL (CAAX protease family)
MPLRKQVSGKHETPLARRNAQSTISREKPPICAIQPRCPATAGVPWQPRPVSPKPANLLRAHPLAAYFVLTFAISWTAALLVAAPRLIAGLPLTKLTGILMFPAMLAGPASSGLLLTWLLDGRPGLSVLAGQVFRFRFPLPWYVPLLIPPAAITAVLCSLTVLVSPAFRPNFFPLGMAFGISAGIFEEIGWTGFAFPRMREHLGAFQAAILLGLLWALWHFPVVNYLGAATPHDRYWVPYFLAFAFAMSAIRVLICWLYTHTGSVGLAQLTHISSTGALVVLSPPHATPAQEATWYAIYGAVLWLGILAAGGRTNPSQHSVTTP